MKITGKLDLSPFGLNVKKICELQHIYQMENLINPRRGEVNKTISIFRSISSDHKAITGVNGMKTERTDVAVCELGEYKQQ